MRRKEKEIKDKDKIIKVFNDAQVCRIAFNDSPFPYIVPVHFVYTKDCFYFHSAEKGRKIELIEKDGRVCFEIDRQIKLISDKQACKWSTKYESLIGVGKAIIVKDLEEKREAFLYLMDKYSGSKNWKIPQEELKKVTVVRVDISNITGKLSES